MPLLLLFSRVRSIKIVACRVSARQKYGPQMMYQLHGVANDSIAGNHPMALRCFAFLAPFD
jgi:hypothetical protein